MKKIFLILVFILLFAAYEVAVWLGARFLFPGSEYLILFIMTALALTLVLVYWLVSRTPRQPEASGAWQPSAPEVPVVGPDELEESGDLKTLLTEANERLAISPKFPKARIRPSLTDFPLYLLVGLEGTQPGEILTNSGLEYDLLAGEPLEPTGFGTGPGCRIWFADQVVFTEVSGNLFTENASWRSLLTQLGPKRGLIRRLRSLWTGKEAQHNLEGVILVLDVAQFLGKPDPQALSRLAQTVRDRLRRLGEVFQVNFPVYLLLSQCEQIEFFEDFFARVNELEEHQILGCSLSLRDIGEGGRELYQQKQGKRLAAAFGRLRQSLARKRIDLLPREEVVEKRGAIYEFPRELGRIRDALIAFMVEAFQPNPLRPNPLLRGFYFAGRREAEIGFSKGQASETVTKSASTIGGSSATMFFQGGQLGEEPRRESSARTTRWAFLGELFKQLVAPERTIVSGGFVNHRIRIYRYVVLGAATFVLLLFSFCFLRSWYNNRQMLSTIEEEVQASNTVWAANPTLNEASLEALEVMRARLAELTEYHREGAPWRMRWWLYSGDDVWKPLRDLYFARFRQFFLDDILKSLSQTLAQAPSDPTASDVALPVGKHLKAYRMITSQECIPDQMFLSDALSGVWQVGWTGEDRVLGLARQQIEFYSQELELENPYDLPEDGRLVDRAQQHLQRLGGSDRVYQQWLSEARLGVDGLADFGPTAREVLDVPEVVRPEYTVQGWERVRSKDPDLTASGEPCVVGKGALSQGMESIAVTSGLRQRYLREYARAWKEYLSNTKLRAYSSSGDAARKLEALGGNRSPLLELMGLVGGQTDLLESIDKGTAAELKGAAEGLYKRVMGGSEEEEQPKVEEWSVQTLKDRFQPVHRVVDPRNDETRVNPRNQEYIQALQRLGQTMEQISRLRSSSPGYDGLHAQANQDATQALSIVAQMSTEFGVYDLAVDQEVKRLLREPVRQAQRFIVTDRVGNLAAQLNGAYRRLCQQFRPLRNKYPFNPSSTSDATLQELSSVFAFEGGSLWKFHKDHLSELMIQEGDQYVQNPEQSEPALSENFLRTFSRLAAISEALFADSLNSPRTSYRFRPQPHPKIETVSINLNGVLLESSSERSQSGRFTWPGPAGNQRVLIRATVRGTTLPFASYEGPWGLFKMIQDADTRTSGSSLLQFSKFRQGRGLPEPITVDGEPITFSMEILDFPGGIEQAFDQAFFSSIDCSGNAAR